MGPPTAPAEPAAGGDRGLPNKVDHLVIDSGALIRGTGYRLASLAEHFWTIPEVVAEVRDPKSRFHVQTLPFELKTRQPTEQAYKAVVEFARKTGDLAALSKVDLRVLALAYTLEAEAKGSVAHLRTVPAAIAARLAAGRGSAAGGAQGTRPVVEAVEEGIAEEVVTEGPPVPEDDEEELEVVEECEDSSDDDEDDDDDEEEGTPGGATSEDAGQAEESCESDIEEQEEKEGLDNKLGRETATHGVGSCEVAQDEAVLAQKDDGKPAAAPLPSKPAAFSWADAVKKPVTEGAKRCELKKKRGDDAESVPVIPVAKQEVEVTSKSMATIGPTPASKGDGCGVSRLLGAAGGGQGMNQAAAEAEDDGEGWINVGNIKEARKRGGGMFGAVGSCKAAPLKEHVDVACVTTDFAMQNILLQMGLRLLSIDGLMVRRVKQWARRCEACAKVVFDQERLFCPRCGNPYLTRVSVALDGETGKLQVFLKKNYRPRTRGCKYPLPKPGSGGRFEGDLLLREDQLMMGIWAQKVRRRHKEVDSMFGADITEDLGMRVKKPYQDIQVGMGKKNPNAQKGRERRGKRKKKSTK